MCVHHCNKHTHIQPSRCERRVPECERASGDEKGMWRAGGEGAYLTWCLLWFIFLTNTRHNAHNNDCGGYTLLKSFLPSRMHPEKPFFSGFFLNFFFFVRFSRVKVLRWRVYVYGGDGRIGTVLYSCVGVVHRTRGVGCYGVDGKTKVRILLLSLFLLLYIFFFVYPVYWKYGWVPHVDFKEKRFHLTLARPRGYVYT